MILHVDTRYEGNHGIGRYSTEVLSRLSVPYVPFAPTVEPGKPTDALNISRMKLRRGALLYSPGYSTGWSKATQLLTLHDLIHLDGPSTTSQSKQNALYYQKFVRPAVLKCGHVVTVSETSARRIRTWLDDDRVAVHNCGNGCSADFTLDGPAFPSARPYFLYVGNLKAHKNARPAFEAMKAFPGHELIVVTQQVDQARDLANSCGTQSRVTIRSSVTDPELATLYRGATALLFPSLVEGFGLPPIEAMRCGTKTVYFAGCDSVAETVGSTWGLPVTDHTSSREFAQAMEQAIASPDMPTSPRGLFSWDAVASKVAKVLDLVLSEHP